MFRLFLRVILYIFLRHRNRGKRSRKRNGIRVQRIRAEYRKCGKRTLYGTPLYTRRCIRIRVMCTTEHDLSHEFTVPGLDWEVSRQTYNPRFGSTYRRQKVRPRQWEIYESDLFITLRLQSTFASSTKITQITSRSNANQVPWPRLVLQVVVV